MITEYDSIGGAGNFSLMGEGGFDHNPVQIDAYLKRASGWGITTDLDANSSLIGTVTASAGSNFNHFYRFQKPGVATEYYLVENRQQNGHDALIPGAGIAIWHVDELGDRDNQSLVYNTTHANYELTLVQADNQWHFENNMNAGDSQDLYYQGNNAPSYANEFTDVTAPSARWWDGSLSRVSFGDFSGIADSMTFRIGAGLVSLKVASTTIEGGNGNGVIDYNECNSLYIVLTNISTIAATNVQATLSTTTRGVAIAQRSSAYPDIPGGGSAPNRTAFKISTSPSFVCGTPIDLALAIKCNQSTITEQFSLSTGVPGAPLRFDSAMPVAIPDPGEASSIIVVSNVASALSKVTVSLFVTHTYDSDLLLELISPDGTSSMLSANNGSFGNNYGTACAPDSARTTFDDAALTPITSGTAPFVGTFQPQTPLSVFIGKADTNVNGAWRLRAVDQMFIDSGTVQCWSLSLEPAQCVDGGGECPGADLALGMTSQPEPVVVGSYLTYTISVTNNGPGSPKNVTVSHLLPGGVIFISATSSQGACSQAGGVVTCSLGQVNNGGRATITVVVQPALTGNLTSTASVSSSEPDPDASNNSATIVSRANPPTADLVVGLLAMPNPVLVGGTLTYTVSVTNNGPSAASGVMVTNVLPASMAVLSATVSGGSVITVGNGVLWNLSTLAAAGRATATITVKPTAEGLFTATARAAGNQYDPIAANNTATIATTVGAASDLAVGIAGPPAPVVVTNNMLYTVSVTNLGPSTATSVVVNNSLPPSLDIVSTRGSKGTVVPTGGALTWNIGTLSVGEKATLEIWTLPTTNGTLTTTAAISGTQADPNPANNTAANVTLAADPFVSILANSSSLLYESGPVNGAVDPGETVTVSLGLLNAGNVTASVRATLLATNGVVPITGNPPLSATNSKPYGILEPGFPAPQAFSFEVSSNSSGTISAVLQLQGGSNTLVTFTFALPNTFVSASTNALIIPDPATPHPQYPLQSGPAKPYPSAISVSNLVGVLGKVTVTLSTLTHGYPGDVNALLVAPNGASVLLMSHAGNQPVAGLNLTFDDSAAGLLPASGQLVSGVYQPTAYTDPIPTPTFPAGAPAGPYSSALSSLIGANPNGTWSLYVLDDSGGDDGSIANGWSLALSMITPVNHVVDLRSTAVAAPSPVVAGGSLTYTFSVTNNGPNSASSVAFTNPLPAGVVLVSASASQGTVITNGTSVVASLATLNTGAVATVTVIVVPTAAIFAPGLNTATVTSTAWVAASETEVNPDNNSVSVMATVNRPVANVGLVQVAAPDPVYVGSELTNTVSITNYGPGTALSVVLTQPIPLGSVFITNSANAGPGIFVVSTNEVACLLGDLAANASATVSFVFTNAMIGFMTNTVTLGTASQDPDPTNNTATTVVKVINPAPNIVNAGALVTYESGPVDGAIEPNETVTLSLALANTGARDTSTNLTATLLPTGGVTTNQTGPQIIHYAPLVAGGPSASGSFTFKAAAVLGNATVVTLVVQDESAGLTNQQVAFTFGAPVLTPFTNTAAITIPDHGPGMAYQSTITVSGLTGQVSKATVTLNQLTHTFPQDVNVLLVSPTGGNVLLMSHAGAGYSVTNPITLTFDDAAAGTLPNNLPLASGTYQPISYPGAVSFVAPAPAGPYGSALSAVNGRIPTERGRCMSSTTIPVTRA